ncbi:MAG: response regulator [Lachnospiraceae bacterium]
MYSVLIADDEPIIRRGLKKIINWEELGFRIEGETGDGKSALQFILDNCPDVVLLDIKMPEMSGLELMRQARAAGYHGKVIILSGYSDFAYAQEAIQYQVKSFLCKPVEKELLTKELQKISAELDLERADSQTLNLYKEKAADTLLKEILTGECDVSRIPLQDIHMDADCYQVVIYEKYHRSENDTFYHFSELLRVANKNMNSFLTVDFQNNEVIILKGDYAISKFRHFLEHYNGELKPQEGSPLDSLFLAYGSIVKDLREIPLSYSQARKLLERRFFCQKGQHTLGAEALEGLFSTGLAPNAEMLSQYTSQFTGFIQAGNRDGLTHIITELSKKLYFSDASTDEIKLFLTDLFIRIKEKLSLTEEGDFPSNSQIINLISGMHYLYEITDFFLKEFDAVLKNNQSYSKASTIENILAYIRKNYRENLRLDAIANAFGYNTSYLGQVFNAKTGYSFNTYLEKVRIEKACELLENPELKVYDIAEMVGYKNVDYFHLKFKKQMNQSPLEYRRSKLSL